jgi:hypothetical protein
MAFQRAQRASMERQRTFLEGLKIAMGGEETQYVVFPKNRHETDHSLTH